MKVTRKTGKEFEPIVIELETEKEAALMQVLFEHGRLAAEGFKSYEYYAGGIADSDEIEDAVCASNLWNLLKNAGLKESGYKKYFSKDRKGDV